MASDHQSPAHSPAERAPDAHVLSSDSSARLHDAVRRSAAVPVVQVSDDASLRDAIAGIVAEARERGMRPEELIPAFKTLLDSFPETRGTGGRLEEGGRFRERLVTLCIKTYYGA